LPAVVQRLRILACLAAIDGTSHDQESALIKEMMSNCEIPSAEEDVILESLASCQQIEVKYEILAANPSDSVGVLVDMVALSRRDNIVYLAERIYIRKVGEILGVAEADEKDLIETACTKWYNITMHLNRLHSRNIPMDEIWRGAWRSGDRERYTSLTSPCNSLQSQISEL
jgi:hypothetical protein